MTQSLIVASAGFLSLGALSMVLGLLLSKDGFRKSISFSLGYFLSYVIVGIAFVSFFDLAISTSDTSGSESPVLLLFFGAILLLIGLRNLAYWNRPSKEPATTRFLKFVDKLTLARTFLIGFVIPLINFKNLTIFLSSLSLLSIDSSNIGLTIATVLIIAAIFCGGVIVPNLVVITLPKQSKKLLSGFKIFLEKYSKPIATFVPLILGLLFLVNTVIL